MTGEPRRSDGRPSPTLGRYALRITHVGPRRAEIGGVQTVLRDYEANVPDRARFRFIATYTARSRIVSALLFALALIRIWITPRSVLGSVHLHVAKHGSVWRKATIAAACRQRGVPVAATVHASQLEDDLRRHPRSWSRLLARCNAVGTLSRKAADGMSHLAPAARVERVSNRVPVPAETVPAPRAKRVLFAGAVSRRKGVDVLLGAWATVLERHPDARLLVAGPAADVGLPELPGLQHLGAPPPAEVRALIRDVDIAVLPSRSEGMPMFVLEALAGGRPVVTTDIEDLADVVGNAGLVVEPGSPTQLADALSELLADPDEASRRGGLGRARVTEHWNIANVGNDLRRLHHSARQRVA